MKHSIISKVVQEFSEIEIQSQSSFGYLNINFHKTFVLSIQEGGTEEERQSNTFYLNNSHEVIYLLQKKNAYHILHLYE